MKEKRVKELIINPTVSESDIPHFLSTLKGITTLNIDPTWSREQILERCRNLKRQIW